MRQLRSRPRASRCRAAGDFILYKLDGDRNPEAGARGGKLLHGWLILDACPIADDPTRNRIFAAFDEGIDQAPPSERSPDCFNPRHAISVTGPNGVRNDWLICFQCSNWYLYEDGTMVGGGGTSDSPAGFFDRIISACAGKDTTDDE